MNTVTTEAELALSTDVHGVVLDVIRDGLDVRRTVSSGMSLSDICVSAAPDSIMAFLRKIIERGASFDQSATLRCGSQIQECRLCGARLADRIVIVGTRADPADRRTLVEQLVYTLSKQALAMVPPGANGMSASRPSRSDDEAASRNRELRCLYEISRLVEDRETSVDAILQGATEALRQAFEGLGVLGVRICRADRAFETPGLKEAEHRLTSELCEYDKPVGRVEVHLDSPPDPAGDPKTWAPKQELLTNTAERLGRIIERFQAEEDLIASRRELERRVAQRTAELAEVNERLEREAEELERSNADLEQFAYVASHDLQEPLRMVSSFCKLLKQRYGDQLDQDANEFMDFAVDGALRMQKLINDLLAYSRVGRGRLSLRPTPIADVIQRATANLSTAIEDADARIHWGEMPELEVDPDRLVLLFQNLIGNALKFRGDKPPEVHIEAEPEDGGWLFRVRDNGIGIPEEFRERVFGMFQRLHGREEYPGTGIGLALCRRIVERHDGRIWVASESEKGTTFCFRFAASE